MPPPQCPKSWLFTPLTARIQHRGVSSCGMPAQFGTLHVLGEVRDPFLHLHKNPHSVTLPNCHSEPLLIKKLAVPSLAITRSLRGSGDRARDGGGRTSRHGGQTMLKEASRWGGDASRLILVQYGSGTGPSTHQHPAACSGGSAGAGALPQQDSRGFGCHNNWSQASKIVTYFSFNLPFAL